MRRDLLIETATKLLSGDILRHVTLPRKLKCPITICFTKFTIKQKPSTSTMIKILPFDDKSNTAMFDLVSIGRVWEVLCFKSMHVNLFPIGERIRLESSFVNTTLPVLWIAPHKLENYIGIKEYEMKSYLVV